MIGRKNLNSIVGNLLKKNSILTSAVGGIVVINLVLAFTALLRDVFLASYLGTSSQADAFFLAYFIPDTVGNLLLAGALGVAAVPVFSRLYVANDNYRLNTVITNITIYFLLFSLFVMVISYIVRDNIIQFLGFGLGEESKTLCVRLLIIVLPTIVMFPFISIGISVLQVYERFYIPASVTVLFNLVFLGGILYAYLITMPLQKGVYLLAASVLAGVMAMVLLIFAAFKKYRIKVLVRPWASDIMDHSRELKEILKTFILYLSILVSTYMVYTIERFLASNLEVGSIAGLNYAFRLAQFPLWVFVSAVSAVALPSMSKANGLGRMEDLRKTLDKSLRLVFIITLPLSIIFYVLREPIVSIMLQRGSFDSGSVQVTAGILAGYSLTIVFQGVVFISLRAFLAAGRMLLPLVAVVISSAVNIVLDFHLVDVAGSAGLGYGAAIGALINSVMILFILKKEIRLDTAAQLNGFARILAASFPVYLLTALFNKTWLLLALDSGIILKMTFFLIVAATGLLIYWQSLKLMGVSPLEALDTNYQKGR